MFAICVDVYMYVFPFLPCRVECSLLCRDEGSWLSEGVAYLRWQQSALNRLSILALVCCMRFFLRFVSRYVDFQVWNVCVWYKLFLSTPVPPWLLVWKLVPSRRPVSLSNMKTSVLIRSNMLLENHVIHPKSSKALSLKWLRTL